MEPISEFSSSSSPSGYLSQPSEDRTKGFLTLQIDVNVERMEDLPRSPKLESGRAGLWFGWARNGGMKTKIKQKPKLVRLKTGIATLEFNL